MPASTPLRIWNRAKNCEESELVFGEGAIRAIYGNAVGRAFTDTVLSRRFISRCYGAYQSLPLSRTKIPDFITRYAIPMEEFAEREFRTFNDFFIRRFRPAMRPFAADASTLPAFAEGRYFAFERSTETTVLPVKGATLNLPFLLDTARHPDFRRFIGGPAYIARLCPVDYHRFHFPDDGRVGFAARLKGNLHSVNPIALGVRGNVLFENERYLSVLETANFGQLAYLEIGALCVGRIVQSHPDDKPFRRGDEKGYFLFGGSTVILLGEPGAFVPDADLLEKTRSGIEVLVKLGDSIGKKTKA